LVGSFLVDLGSEANGALLCCDASCERVFFVTPALVVVGMVCATGHVFLRVDLVSSGLAAANRDTVSGIEFLADSDCVCVCLRSGDLISVPIKDGVPECVGTVDSGALGMAWSPDGEFVVFATGNATLFCLSRSWMPLAEVPIRAGIAEDGAPARFALSFEGDGSRFATLTQFADDSTHLAIWSRDCNLLSTCEAPPKESLRSCAVAFRPTGFLLAVSHCSVGEDVAEVVLYESNGLAHGGFPLRRGRAFATSLSWNPDASLLALVCDGRLQVWRTSNYMWHLTWELDVGAQSGISIVAWSQAAFGRLLVSTNGGRFVRVLDFMRSLSCSSMTSHGAFDQSIVSVVDGLAVRVTALQRTVIPPLLCEASVPLPFVAGEVAVCGTALSACAPSGQLAVVQLSSETRVPVGDVRIAHLNDDGLWMQVAWVDTESFLALSSSGSIVLVDATSGKQLCSTAVKNDVGCAMRLYCNSDAKFAVLVQGQHVRRIVIQDGGVKVKPLLTLPEVCLEIAVVVNGSLLLGRSMRFKLFAACLAAPSSMPVVVVEPECTSFVLHSRFAVLTTLSSHLRFAALSDDVFPPRIDSSLDRQLETGAVLVACLPRGCRTVVQAPRGSLETVYPRPLVMLASEKLVNAKQLGDFFFFFLFFFFVSEQF
jgi:hypothetical protein